MGALAPTVPLFSPGRVGVNKCEVRLETTVDVGRALSPKSKKDYLRNNLHRYPD
jgi:hypothetical protein